MIENILQIIAPHYCYGCGRAGFTLCDNCKYDIIDEPFSGCIVCQKPARDGICSTCGNYYKKAWCVTERSGATERLINAYKFDRVLAAHLSLADLLNKSLPILPTGTVVVSVPTINSHIRLRGYDHAALLARRFAKLRKLKSKSLLVRQGSSVQRGSSRRERFKQAEHAFRCVQALSPEIPYLLVDDILTTGASLQFAAKTLRDAGAEEVWVAVVARQPLDK